MRALRLYTLLPMHLTCSRTGQIYKRVQATVRIQTNLRSQTRSSWIKAFSRLGPSAGGAAVHFFLVLGCAQLRATIGLSFKGFLAACFVLWQAEQIALKIMWRV